MEIDNLINSFIVYCEVEKNFSIRTIETYRHALDNFYDFLKANNSEQNLLSDLKLNFLRGYPSYLNRTGLSRSSIRLKVSALKSFFKYCYRKKMINENPASLLTIPKREKRLPSFLLQDEVARMLDEYDDSTFENARNRSLMELIYCSGLRISEALNLKKTDVNFTQKTVKVLGKGRKERVVPLGDRAIKALREKYCIQS